jgi:hypothetical protein
MSTGLTIQDGRFVDKRVFAGPDGITANHRYDRYSVRPRNALVPVVLPKVSSLP